MTKDEIIAAVQALGSARQIEQKHQRLVRQDRKRAWVAYSGCALTLILLPFVLTSWGASLPGYGLFASVFAIAFCAAVFGALSEVWMEGPDDYASLVEISKSREALELVEKSEQARLVRDAVIAEGRRLVGRDFYLMRRLCAEEQTGKSREARRAEEEALNARLHLPTGRTE